MTGAGQRRIQGSFDDDPLTSPSFPIVPGDDSRSFRSSRTDGYTSGSGQSAPGAPGAATQQFASYGSRTAEFGASAAVSAGPGSLPSYPDAAPAPGSGYQGGIHSARPVGPGTYPTGSGSHARPGTGAGPASAGVPSAAGAVPQPTGNPYGGYVGTPPNDGLSDRPQAQDPNGRHSGSYPTASDLPASNLPAGNLPTGNLTGRHSGSYPASQDLNGRHSGSYPRAIDLTGSSGGHYQQRQPTSPLNGADDEGTVDYAAHIRGGPGGGGYDSGGYDSGGYDSGGYDSGGYDSGGYDSDRV